MSELNQLPGELDIKISKGDYLSFDVTVDFDLTSHTIYAAIDDSSGTPIVFTVTPGTYSSTSSKITLSLTSTQTNGLTTKTNNWYLQFTYGGNTRTYLAGDFTVIDYE